jgi:hypothetical protein
MSEQGTVHKPTPKNTTIPVKLLHDPNAKDGTIRLYAHMFWRYGSNKKNYEGQKSVARFLGVTSATIGKRVKELEFLDWLVVVERDYNPATGNYTTPHYHLFLSQSDCRKFRAEYTPQEGECVRPKPTENEVNLRVSRAGKGNPNPVRPAVNHANSGSDGQPNSGSDGLANSGSDKRLPVYPSEDANASVNDSTPPSGDVPSADAATPSNGHEPTPKKERPRDWIFDTIALGSFKINNTTVLDKITGKRIGIVASWLKKQDGISQDGETVALIGQFYQWYDKAKNGIARPRDVTKFAEAWTEWQSYKATPLSNGLPANVDWNEDIDWALPEDMLKPL